MAAKSKQDVVKRRRKKWAKKLKRKKKISARSQRERPEPYDQLGGLFSFPGLTSFSETDFGLPDSPPVELSPEEAEAEKWWNRFEQLIRPDRPEVT